MGIWEKRLCLQDLSGKGQLTGVCRFLAKTKERGGANHPVAVNPISLGTGSPCLGIVPPVETGSGWLTLFELVRLKAVYGGAPWQTGGQCG
jgi:hypothetical protein